MVNARPQDARQDKKKCQKHKQQMLYSGDLEKNKKQKAKNDQQQRCFFFSQEVFFRMYRGRNLSKDGTNHGLAEESKEDREGPGNGLSRRAQRGQNAGQGQN